MSSPPARHARIKARIEIRILATSAPFLRTRRHNPQRVNYAWGGGIPRVPSPFRAPPRPCAGSSDVVYQVGGKPMSRLPLTLACWNYDRTRALADGSIAPDGIDLNYLNLPVEETFFRMLRHCEFDAAELSLSSYTVSLFRENPPFIAIPV